MNFITLIAIKKFLKILAKLTAVLLLLLIIFMLLLSIPSVQTRLGKYATDRLNKDYNTNITIDKIGLQFNLVGQTAVYIHI